MITMELTAVRILFLGTLLKGGLGADEMSSMCPHIQNAFMNGMMSFKFEDDKGKFLADNGFTGKPTDVSFYFIFYYI